MVSPFVSGKHVRVHLFFETFAFYYGLLLPRPPPPEVGDADGDGNGSETDPGALDDPPVDAVGDDLLDGDDGRVEVFDDGRADLLFDVDELLDTRELRKVRARLRSEHPLHAPRPRPRCFVAGSGSDVSSADCEVSGEDAGKRVK